MPPAEPIRRDDEFLTVTDAVRVPMSEFSFTFMRSSGPGGQNVNKVSSKARLRWPVVESQNLDPAIKERFLERYRSRITTEGEFLLTSQRYRDQARNLTDCLEKLREMIADVAEPPKKRKTKRKEPRGAKERRIKQKREQSVKKQLRKPPRGSD